MRILLHCPNSADATSFYRAVGPFRRLAVDLQVTQACDWQQLLWADVVFLQRPQSLAARELARNAKHLGVPIWVDYDDDFFSLPKEHPAHAAYESPEMRSIIRECLLLADQVSVSTPALASSLYRNADVSAAIIPNAVDDALWGLWDTERENVIVWRGSSTHTHDMDGMGGEILPWLNAHLGYDIAWFGWRPWWAGAIPMSRQAFDDNWDDCLTYLRKLTDLSPRLVFVPLLHNDFNAAKSNIAWLEATAAGAVCVASPVAEFVRPGCIVPAHPGCWAASFDYALSNAESYLSESRQKIESDLLLSRVNVARERILDRLCARKSTFGKRSNLTNP